MTQQMNGFAAEPPPNPSAELTSRLADEAVVAARERGCTCTFPDIWLTKGNDEAEWSAMVPAHEECLHVEALEV